MSTDDERLQRAQNVMNAVFGTEWKTGRRDNEPAVAEDLSRILLEHSFADAWGRPGLDARTRSFVTMSMAIAQGSMRELRNHVVGALHLGITPEEIVELLIHAAAYCGVGRAATAWSEVRRLIAEHANSRE